MRRFLTSQLRHRPARSIALALGVVVSAVAFVLLTGSAETSALRVRGTLKSNFRGAYDILVRPTGSFTQLEERQGLVRDNYLSGIFGGITLAQYHDIERISGIQVAAPIANVGYLMFPGQVNLPLKRSLTQAKNQLFRVTWSWVSNGGLSRYPAGATYLYYTTATPAAESRIPICTGFDASRPKLAGPFDLTSAANLTCSWPSPQPPAFRPQTSFQFFFPVLLSAIDPVQEARLLHLDQTIAAGRYLSEDAGLKILANGRRVVSVLASTKTFLGDQLVANVQRLRPPAHSNIDALLSSGACRAQVVPCPQAEVETPPAGWPHSTTAYRFLSELPGRRVATRSFSASAAYKAATTSKSYESVALGGQGISSDALWTASPSRYRTVGANRLVVQPETNSPSIWTDPLTYANDLWFPAPPQNQDTQFRRLHESPGVNRGFGQNGATQDPLMRVVGRFDPGRLPGFSKLSSLPLETYYPPELRAADAYTKSILHNKPLLPTQNLGDYIQQPPLLLTSLDALSAFTNPHAFSGISARQRRAPISVIRVRVAGVTGTDQLSRLRIRTVAQQIHDKTGLDVDITAGTSPHPLEVTLPAGKFGRPQLELAEGWSKKGVTISYLKALDRKDIALYALILVVCAIFLLNSALATVRTRRAEIGTLLTLGWSRSWIFRSVLGETVLVGAIAGVIGTGLAAVLVRAFNISLPLSRTLLVLPIAVGLALLAGAIPAYEAASGVPLDALRPSVHARRRARSIRGKTTLAMVNLTRLPVRTGLGVAGLALGAAALTVLIAIERSFHGTLVGTLLGNAVSLQVHDADFVAVSLTISLAALSAADVLYMNLRERAAEFVTLQTTGWSNSQLIRLVMIEAGALGLISALVGSATGIVIGGLLLGVPYWPLTQAAAFSGVGVLITALVASLIPARQLLQLSPTAVLSAE